MKHLHFGAGRLGLALAVAMASKAGMSSVVCNRETDDDVRRDGDQISPKRRNEILQANHAIRLKALERGERLLQEIELGDFLTYNGIHTPPQRIARHINPIGGATPEPYEPCLVTCAVGNENGYAFPARVVAKAAIDRHMVRNNTPIYLMAFENAIRVDFFASQVKEAVARDYPNVDFASLSIIPIDIIADRICTSLREETSSETGRSILVVACEPFYKVFADAQSVQGPFAQAMAPVGKHFEASTFLDFEIKRKLWVLNGVHGLVALLALYDKKETLPDFFNNPPHNDGKHRLPFHTVNDKQRTVKDILSEISLGFRHDAVSQGERGQRYLDVHYNTLAEARYLSETYDRLPGNMDFPARIVQRFTNPNESRPNQVSVFLQRFAPRVVMPMERYINKTGHAPRESTLAILRLLELVEQQEYVRQLPQPDVTRDFGPDSR